MAPAPGPTRETPIATLPEVIVTLHRNGSVIDHAGAQVADPVGKGLPAGMEALWQEPLLGLIRQLTRKAIASRGSIDAELIHGPRRYQLRVTAKGPDRAVCSIRPSLTAPAPGRLPARGSGRSERKEFLRRVRDSIAGAALRERPLALAIIHLDGISDVAQVLDREVARQIMQALLQRLPSTGQDEAGVSWYAGELADGLLAQVLSSTDRDLVHRCVTQLCASLREPVRVGGCAFHLTPYAGVALLGQDASAPRMLLNHARHAAHQARSCGLDPVCFFTDTLRLKSLSSLDIVRELREAIARRHIRLRYAGRHDLTTDRLVARVGYLRWQHPLRGEIRPTEFLRVAETTGLALDLSRSMLLRLKEDYAHARARGEHAGHISFGPLRHHVLHEAFIRDIEELLADSVLPPEHLELRIAEKTFISCEPEKLHALHGLGVQLVVDEVARGMGSLDCFARVPVWGLQLDRAWVTALHSDDASLNAVALKVCRAAISVARALGVEPIATGVDNLEQRNALLTLGCSYGAGDLFGAPTIT
jgi:diguanylate cyclase